MSTTTSKKQKPKRRTTRLSVKRNDCGSESMEDTIHDQTASTTPMGTVEQPDTEKEGKGQDEGFTVPCSQKIVPTFKKQKRAAKKMCQDENGIPTKRLKAADKCKKSNNTVTTLQLQEQKDQIEDLTNKNLPQVRVERLKDHNIQANQQLNTELDIITKMINSSSGEQSESDKEPLNRWHNNQKCNDIGEKTEHVKGPEEHGIIQNNETNHGGLHSNMQRAEKPVGNLIDINLKSKEVSTEERICDEHPTADRGCILISQMATENHSKILNKDMGVIEDINNQSIGQEVEINSENQSQPLLLTTDQINKASMNSVPTLQTITTRAIEQHTRKLEPPTKEKDQIKRDSRIVKQGSYCIPELQSIATGSKGEDREGVNSTTQVTAKSCDLGTKASSRKDKKDISTTENTEKNTKDTEADAIPNLTIDRSSKNVANLILDQTSVESEEAATQGMTTSEGMEEEIQGMTTSEGMAEEIQGMTTVEGKEEETHNMTTVEGMEEEIKGLTTSEGMAEEIQGMTTVESKEEETHNMTTVQGTEEEIQGMTTVEGKEEETQDMATVQGTEEETQGMTRVEGTEVETQDMATVEGTEEEIQGMTTVEGTEEEKHNMATLEGTEEEIQGLTTLEGTEVETQEMATVEGVEAEEISDSQLCAISTMDWTEEPLGPFGDTGRGHDSKTPAVPPSLPDGTAIVKSLIREVSNLNMMLLRAKREMQAANQRKLQTPTNDNRVNMLAKK